MGEHCRLLVHISALPTGKHLIVHWDDGECTEIPASAQSSALTQESARCTEKLASALG